MTSNKKRLVDAFLTNKSQKEMLDFLEAILSPKELASLSMRLKIVRLLKKGMPQRQIAEKLGVGIATVTRGSKQLKKGRFKKI
ncbi:Trp family transcriptional regulator [Patescibacteria group bacterium]